MVCTGPYSTNSCNTHDDEDHVVASSTEVHTCKVNGHNCRMSGTSVKASVDHGLLLSVWRSGCWMISTTKGKQPEGRATQPGCSLQVSEIQNQKNE